MLKKQRKTELPNLKTVPQRLRKGKFLLSVSYGLALGIGVSGLFESFGPVVHMVIQAIVSVVGCYLFKSHLSERDALVAVKARTEMFDAIYEQAMKQQERIDNAGNN